MGSPREFLEAVQGKGLATGHFRGLLFLLVGKRITTTGGEVVSSGMSWREAAALFKKVRWQPESVTELGIDPADLPPRDREKFWYLAINRAALSSPEATREAEALIPGLRELGYEVA